MARDLDDIAKRNKYKEEKFNGKKSTKDEYTGKRIFWGNQKDAAHKHPTTKTTDVDHITPIDVIEKRYKYLKPEQRKKLANSDSNLALTNSKLNRSKGRQENHEYLYNQAKKGDPEALGTAARMLNDEAISRGTIRAKATVMYGENVADSFGTGAADAVAQSSMVLVSEGAQKLVQVAQGEISLEDAAKDMGKVTANTVVRSGTNRVLVDTATTIAEYSTDTVFQEIASSSAVAQLIAVGTIVEQSAIRYINGEIDGKEFMEEIGEKGTTLVAGMIGSDIGTTIGAIVGGVVGTLSLPGIGTIAGKTVGAAVGQVLGTIITTVACSGIISVLQNTKHLDDYKEKEYAIRQLERAALREMENQRSEFQSIVAQSNAEWDQAVMSGFNQMLAAASAEEPDPEGIAGGLDMVLSVFGKTARYHTMEEFEADWDAPLCLSF